MAGFAWTADLWDSFLEVCSEEGRLLVRPDQGPGETIRVLQAAWHFADALLLAARLLPPREAVWWGCVCTWSVAAEDLNEAEIACLRAALRWVVHPTEESRRAAGAIAQSNGIETPAGALALAAFLSGDLGHPDFPVAAPSDACSTACSSAVSLAAVHRDPMMYNWHYCRFIGVALQIAQGQHRWDAADAAMPMAAALEPAQPAEIR